MNDAFLLLTPVLVFVIVALVGFVGCGGILPASADTLPEGDPVPEQVDNPPKAVSKNPATKIKSPIDPVIRPPTYEELVINAFGFLAYWPLNEAQGTVAEVSGPLKPMANGVYTNAAGTPLGAGSFGVGKQGVLFAKDNTDLAAEFAGTEAFIEVPFQAPLNVGPGLEFTIELWAKPDPTLGADRGVLVSSHHFESVAQQQGFEIGMLKVAGQTHQQIYARVYSGTGSTQTEIAIQPVDGAPDEWRHIVFRHGVVSGQGLAIRLRSQVLKTAKVEEKITTVFSYENVTSQKATTLRFAGGHAPVAGGGVPLYAGRLDAIAFYNTQLSDAEIAKRFDMASS
ncbi:MAG TPA: hypothetical protein VF042_12950 [Gemmatimonadaceae bacterium]